MTIQWRYLPELPDTDRTVLIAAQGFQTYGTSGKVEEAFCRNGEWFNSGSCLFLGYQDRIYAWAELPGMPPIEKPQIPIREDRDAYLESCLEWCCPFTRKLMYMTMPTSDRVRYSFYELYIWDGLQDHADMFFGRPMDVSPDFTYVKTSKDNTIIEIRGKHSFVLSPDYNVEIIQP